MIDKQPIKLNDLLARMLGSSNDGRQQDDESIRQNYENDLKKGEYNNEH